MGDIIISGKKFESRINSLETKDVVSIEVNIVARDMNNTLFTCRAYIFKKEMFLTHGQIQIMNLTVLAIFFQTMVMNLKIVMEQL